MYIVHCTFVQIVYDVQCIYIILHNAHSQEGNLLKTTGSVGTGAPLDWMLLMQNILGGKY